MAESIATVGKLAGVCGHDGTDWQKVGISATDRLTVETEAADGTDLKDVLDKLAEILAELVSLDSGLQLRRGDHVVSDYDDVPGDTGAHTLVNLTGAGTLEWLNFASDHASSYLAVRVDGDYLLLADVVTPATTTSISCYVIRSGQKEDSLWKVIAYDSGNSLYGIGLKRPIWFNSGLYIVYVAGSATAKVCAALGYHLF